MTNPIPGVAFEVEILGAGFAGVRMNPSGPSTIVREDEMWDFLTRRAAAQKVEREKVIISEGTDV